MLFTNNCVFGNDINEYSSNSPSYWAVDEVTSAASIGLLTENMQCNYQESITREDFCILIINMLKTYNPHILNTDDLDAVHFNDTKNGNIETAATLGIVAGVGDDKFNPEGKITRQEAARMLYMAATIPERIPTKSEYYDDSYLTLIKRIDIPYAFNDISQFEHWSALGIQFCYQNNIMFGVGNNLFSPNSTYTREQSYLTVLRLYNVFFCKIDYINNANIHEPFDDRNMYTYDTFNGWTIVMKPIYSRLDNTVNRFDAILYDFEGNPVWIMPYNLHFTTDGNIVHIEENVTTDSDNIAKTQFILFDVNAYQASSDYSTTIFSVYKK